LLPPSAASFQNHRFSLAFRVLSNVRTGIVAVIGAVNVAVRYRRHRALHRHKTCLL